MGHTMPHWNSIANHISSTTGTPFQCQQIQQSGGGCINQTYRISDQQQRYFVKLNQPQRTPMFAAEAAGLQAIATTQTIRVPAVICHGANTTESYLVLENLDLGTGGPQSQRQLGQQLAQMHRHSASQFGWHLNNTLGTTPQPNTQNDNWIEFWRSHRLGQQLQLAAANGYGGTLQALGQQLLDRLDDFFIDHQPEPSLLHGDLWSGNYAIATNGTPLIFDPAVYYGDRETDIAMTELFGGFAAEFYQGYESEYPLAPGYQQRKPLYNLYHILNHLNLFGGGYQRQAVSMVEQLLRG